MRYSQYVQQSVNSPRDDIIIEINARFRHLRCNIKSTTFDTPTRVHTPYTLRLSTLVEAILSQFRILQLELVP